MDRNQDRHFFGQAMVAILSQAISSLTNFAFIISLIGSLTPEDFGLYSVAFAFVLAGAAIFQGFFQLQMVTKLPHLDVSKIPSFVSSLFILQLICGLIITLIIGILTRLITPSSEYFLFIMITCAAVISIASKELLIRYLFASNQKTGWILLINLMLAVMIFILIITNTAMLSPIHAMAAYAVAHLVASAIGLFVSPLDFKHLKLTETFKSIFNNGSWAALSAFIYSLRSSAHTFIVAGHLSLTEVGRMNAARTIVTPVTLLIPSLSSLMLPRLSQTFASHGRIGVQKLTLILGCTMFTAVLVYAGLLFFAWPTFNSRVLDKSFTDIGPYVALWIIYALAIAFRNVSEWASQSMNAFQDLARINLFVSLVAISIIFIATKFYGVPGAIIAISLSEFLMCTIVLLRTFA